MSHEPSPQQRAIIDFPHDRPLRVTAGAGTGKTTTLAQRLAAHVKAGSVGPDRTLGITFTNKAAAELASAVRTNLAGTVDPGSEVEVTTYHGFAFSIVREFGPLVGVARSVRVVTPGYVRQMLRDALGSKTRLHLDLTNPGTEVGKLLGVASSLGDHLAAPSALIGVGAEDLRPARAEIADVIDSFQAAKRSLGVVDYADLVGIAHSIVDRRPDIAGRIRSRYDLVLLDEYQDTNPGQRLLLLALFGDGFPVTAVGDSDQTIYEWRGAAPENFEAFPKHFHDADGTEATSLSLSVSWRSGPEIVALANEVRNEISRPGPLPRLEAAPSTPPSVVRAHWLHDSVAEARWIADDVVRLHQEDGCAWRDMAVLFRKHRQMATIRDALGAMDVPVEVVSLGGLLDVPEVADLHAWLRVLGRPDDAPALARILLGSRYRLGLGDLAPLARWVAQHRGVSEEASIGWAMLEAVDALDDVVGLSDEARARLAGFRTEYRTLLGTAQSVSLVELARSILDTTNAWAEIEALPAAARLSARLNTYRFLDLSEDWSPLDRRPSLEAFLDHLDVLSDEAAAEELDTAVISGEDAVALLTVHRAKGLEWPVVYLPALAAGTFPSAPVRYPDPMKFADVVPHELRIDRSHLPDLSGDDAARKEALGVVHNDGEWRTAYVAVTRAARELIATGAWWYSPKTAKKRSRLFEIIDAAGAAEPNRSTEPGEPPETLVFRADHGTGPDPHFPEGISALLRSALRDPGLPRTIAAQAGLVAQYDSVVEQLEIQLAGLPEPPPPTPNAEEFRTSVTGLVTYAGCGLRYRWEHIERLPRRPSPAARRGSEIHKRIEVHHRGTLTLDDAADPTEWDDSDEATARPETIFTRFLQSRYATERPILIETPFELRIGSVPVSGRIDAVYEPSPGEWEIVDFKSGRPGTNPARTVQLEAYAVAAADVTLEGRTPPHTTTVSFVYLGGDELTVESSVVDDAWLEAARDHLSELTRGAAEGPHDPAPGEACRHCDFSRFCPQGAGWLEANR